VDYNSTTTFSNGVTLVGGNLIVPAGVSSFTITTVTINDVLIENSENYNLSVGGVAATGTITDNDVPPPNILNGTLVTNSNNVVQSSILTIAQTDSPFNAYATFNDLNLQGQQGSLNKDVGFDVIAENQYQVALEAVGSTKVIVTDFTLEGAVINAPGGSDNPQLEVDGKASGTGGNNVTAFTAIITPDDPVLAGNTASVDQAQTVSLDGSSGANTLTDPSAGFHYLAGDGGNDTLNGGTGADILNGGTGIDTVNGGAGNDILVYDPLDLTLDGGAGIDLLRLDGSPTANSTINLTGETGISGIEGLLITDDTASSASIGTTVVLNAADVLDFTSGNIGLDVNTLHVLGNAGDHLDLNAADNWVQGATTSDGFVTYTSAALSVTLLVDSNVTVDLT
jgi:Ca2+-binding RTX toxin-like protein